MMEKLKLLDKHPHLLKFFKKSEIEIELVEDIMFYYSFSANGPNKMGVGSVIAFIMFAIMIIFGFIRMRLIRRSEIG